MISNISSAIIRRQGGHTYIPLNCHTSGVSLTFLPAISRSHTQVDNSHALLQIQCQISPNRPTNRQIAYAVFSI